MNNHELAAELRRLALDLEHAARSQHRRHLRRCSTECPNHGNHPLLPVDPIVGQFSEDAGLLVLAAAIINP